MSGIELHKVETSLGTFTLRKPKAVKRQEALLTAEKDAGEGKELSIVSFMNNILPKCIVGRPESVDKDVPITDLLAEMEDDDYDALMSVALSLVDFKFKGLKKKMK